MQPLEQAPTALRGKRSRATPLARDSARNGDFLLSVASTPRRGRKAVGFGATMLHSPSLGLSLVAFAVASLSDPAVSRAEHGSSPEKRILLYAPGFSGPEGGRKARALGRRLEETHHLREVPLAPSL
jgi:hypothetical protein